MCAISTHIDGMNEKTFVFLGSFRESTSGRILQYLSDL